MTRRQFTHLYINAVAGTAVLLAVYTGNPWAAAIPSTLFVFVLFPRWRTKLFRLIQHGIEKIGGGRDRCDPE